MELAPSDRHRIGAAVSAPAEASLAGPLLSRPLGPGGPDASEDQTLDQTLDQTFPMSSAAS